MERQDLRETLVEFMRRQPHVRLAYLFGSQARGTAHALSDVDVAVLLDPGVPDTGQGQVRLRLATDLAQVLHSEDVDVVILNRAPLLLRYEVLRGGRLLFAADDEERARFAEDTYVRYLDCRYLYDMLDEAMFRRLREGRFGHQQIGVTGTLRKTRALHQQDPDNA